MAGTLIFPNAEYVNLSAEFCVGSQPVAIRLFNAVDTGELQLEQVVKNDCGDDYVGPVVICCPVMLGTNNTLFVWAVSGTYRLHYRGTNVNDELRVYVEEVAVSALDKSSFCCE